MSDNQRRAMCRLLFLLVCAIPTSITSYWICHPQTAAGWEQAIQAETGIEASIDFVETPSPYETILRQLRLTDPEHGTLFETVEVRIRFGNQVEVEIPYEVRHANNRGLARLLKTMHQNAVRRGVDKPWQLRFSQPLKIARADAPALFAGNGLEANNSLQSMLNDQQNTFVIERLNLELRPSLGSDGTLVGANFTLPQPNNPPTSQPLLAQNRVEVQLTKEPQGQAIWLHTFDQTLPCWLAADFAGEITNGLGKDADFAGELRIQSHIASGQNEVYLNGVLNRLSIPSYPLNESISEKTQMQITLDDCQFVNGQATQWSVVLNVPDLRLRSQIDPRSLFQDSRRVVVGNAINTAFINGLNTRVASEPRRNWQ